VSIQKLLVANRGEIAVRIFETAHEMGLSTVAVFADPDHTSVHMRAADEAVALRGETAAETYLDIDKLLAAARRTGADAVHPGYGFLAENPAFARAVIEAGLTWVGPSPTAIEAMADKVAAKARVGAAGVPLLPSATVEGDDAALWAKAADEIGYPLLVKAAAGGGGKGMTVVASPAELADAVTSARRVAQSSFGDPTVFLERYLLRPRHVEVQVFGDADGTVVHYFTRDCSVQRRHQKVIEEAPAPGLSDELRERLHTSAVAAARSVDYIGAGTVEFLVAGNECFFLEMNTRLQVEHRVTERICAIDLVEMQVRVAGGEVVGLAQDGIEAYGHSIEARLYAEDPAEDFLPSVGRVERFELAARLEGYVPVDASVASGDIVSPYFDPMLAKFVSDGDDRDQAAARLARALRGLQMHGITTNRDSLVAVIEHEAFRSGAVHTGFFDDHPETLAAGPPPDVVRAHAVAATMALRAERDHASLLPKVARAGWRNVGASPARQAFTVTGSAARGQEVVVEYGPPPRSGGRMPVWVDGDPLAVDGVHVQSDRVELDIDDVRVGVDVQVVGDRVWVNDKRWQTELEVVPRFTVGVADASAHGPSSPVPGTVVSVEVTVGDAVTEGQTLVVVEAMKMEHRLAADIDGVVAEVRVAAGDKVDAHQVLVIVDPSGDES